MTEYFYVGGQPIERRPVFQIRTDQIEVTSNLPEPDPNWTYTDAAGHPHAYATVNETAPLQRGMWCPDCDEYHMQHVCKDCGEHIVVGMRGPSMFRSFIPGMTHYLVDGREVSPDDYERLLREANERDGLT